MNYGISSRKHIRDHKLGPAMDYINNHISNRVREKWARETSYTSHLTIFGVIEAELYSLCIAWDYPKYDGPYGSRRIPGA